MEYEVLFVLLKIIVIASIFFVWVVRYNNIVQEFSEYNLPNWFRDIMGIIKLSSCGMILSGEPSLILAAASILGLLMFAAVLTHIKVKHTLLQMLPSMTLMFSSILIGLHTLNII